ncbi:polysaccharide deacetylase family protein [Micromonospora sp. CPCC 206061]|uniref:polysaccharide deacetylase family protein n=1 Tax=Micromonospora sp. CPCC 206061 TaxID=3122410 RepID=UPI002FF3155D
MSTDSVVNVCFHGVGTPRRELEPGEAVYWVDVDRFRRILDEVATWPSVRISFDDGNASDVEIGLPELAERGLAADFFVVAGRLDQPGSVGVDHVRELRHRGMEIGTHGMWHRSWRGLSATESHEELVAARDRLAEVAGQPVVTAALPLGQYDRTVLAALRRSGYRRVFTSDRRTARRGSWLQPRYSVRQHDTPENLRAEILSGPPLARRLRATAAGVVKRWR